MGPKPDKIVVPFQTDHEERLSIKAYYILQQNKFENIIHLLISLMKSTIECRYSPLFVYGTCMARFPLECLAISLCCLACWYLNLID